MLCHCPPWSSHPLSQPVRCHLPPLHVLVAGLCSISELIQVPRPPELLGFVSMHPSKGKSTCRPLDTPKVTDAGSTVGSQLRDEDEGFQTVSSTGGESGHPPPAPAPAGCEGRARQGALSDVIKCPWVQQLAGHKVATVEPSMGQWGWRGRVLGTAGSSAPRTVLPPDTLME